MKKLIKTSSTGELNLSVALEQVAKDLKPESSSLSVLFISDTYPREELGTVIKAHFGTNVVACTTAGEIGTAGYQSGSISGVSFDSSAFACDTVTIENLATFSHAEAQSLGEKIKSIQKKQLAKIPKGKTLGILLIDGLSVKEELVTGMLSMSMDGIPLVGGSAGDGLKFESTGVHSEEKFSSGTASLSLITTEIPFEIFKSQHFCETSKKLVITDSDPTNRVIREINGEPAADAYARALNLSASDLNPTVFSKNPMVLKIGNDYYVRSVQKVNADKSLTFYCAIENGLVLTLAKRENMFKKTGEQFTDITDRIGKPEASIVFECILRRLEFFDMPKDEQEKINNIFTSNNAIGFHTYGEQYGGVHVNQTLTGVAFGKK